MQGHDVRAEALVVRPIVSPALVGCERHLATLDRALEAARAGAGQAVLITSEAGIGKSRLVAELRARAEQLGCVLLQGACFESDRAFPYAPVLDLVRTLAAGQPTEAVAAWLWPAAPQLVRLLPELADRLPGVVSAPALDPEAEKRRLFQAVGQLVARICGRSASAARLRGPALGR